jgi:hypothetical protein
VERAERARENARTASSFMGAQQLDTAEFLKERKL